MNLKFLFKLSLLTALVAVCTLLLFNLREVSEHLWFWAALGFYFVLGVFIGWRTQMAVVSDSNSKFFTGVMGSIGLRLLLCIVFLAIYLMLSEIKGTVFIVYYLILYLFYTIFEISQLVSKLRPEKSSNLDNTTS